MPGGSGAGPAGPGALRRCPGGQKTQRGRPAGRWGCARLPLPCLGAPGTGGGGLVSPGSAAASVPGALRLLPPAKRLPRGAGARRGSSGGSRGAPVAREPRAGGVLVLGLPPAARRGWDGGAGRPVASLGRTRAMLRDGRGASLLFSLPLPWPGHAALPTSYGPHTVGPWHTGQLLTSRSRTLTPTTAPGRAHLVGTTCRGGIGTHG